MHRPTIKNRGGRRRCSLLSSFCEVRQLPQTGGRHRLSAITRTERLLKKGITMSILSSILEKLGFGSANASAQASPEPPVAPAPEETISAPEVPATASAEQVSAKLASLSQAHPELKPENSIVDLLKALGLDSSFEHRKELAKEVGLEGYEGTAEQNMKLHAAVLKKASQ